MKLTVQRWNKHIWGSSQWSSCSSQDSWSGCGIIYSFHVYASLCQRYFILAWWSCWILWAIIWSKLFFIVWFQVGWKLRYIIDIQYYRCINCEIYNLIYPTGISVTRFIQVIHWLRFIVCAMLGSMAQTIVLSMSVIIIITIFFSVRQHEAFRVRN